MMHKKMLKPISIITLSAAIFVASTIAIATNSQKMDDYPPRKEMQIESPLAQNSPQQASGGLTLAGEAPDGFISVDIFKGYVQEYKPSLEFVQRFFDDTIVYYDKGNAVFQPVDTKLPLNNYDFSKLEKIKDKKEMQYIIDGKSVGIKGIDVSSYQGDIDWKKVKADGVDFAIIRLGNRGYETGKLVLDEKYEKNMKGAIAAGVKVGVYFFSQAINTKEAIEEAEMVLKHIKNYKLTYPVVFDAEEVNEESARTKNISAAEFTEITKAFCEKIQSANQKPMIYGNVKWFLGKLDMSKLTQYDKWFAQYYETPFFPYALNMWQYTSSGKVDGIKGNVDMNICFENYP